jgi:hypothetical protein
MMLEKGMLKLTDLALEVAKENRNELTRVIDGLLSPMLKPAFHQNDLKIPSPETEKYRSTNNMKAYATFPYPQQLVRGGEFVPGCLVDVGDVGDFNTIEEAQAILDQLNGAWQSPQPGKMVRPGHFIQGARYISLIKS